MGEFYLVQTPEGVPSLGFRQGEKDFRLHSSYAPRREAERFVQSRKAEILQARAIIVYGIGLGYHLEELAKLITREQKVYVVEMNLQVLDYAHQVISFESLENAGFTFLASDQLSRVGDYLSHLIATYGQEGLMLLIYPPALRVIPEHCTPVRDLFEEWEIKRSTVQRYSGIMEENCRENLKGLSEIYFLESFQGRFSQIPVIIVAAGPSLNKNKHLLSVLKGRALILAVGSVAKVLVEMGCSPDGVVVTDPHPVVCEQLAGLQLDCPLFFFPTIQPQIIKAYPGPRVMMFQFGHDYEALLGRQVTTIRTGGSVATTALEMALLMGGNPVIFVGQDLAFTDGQSHAQGATSQPLSPEANLRWVKGVDGQPVPTARAFEIYLKWIEGRIAENPQTHFIDATEGGAYIKGTEVKRLAEVIAQLHIQVPVESLLAASLQKEMEA